MQVPLLRVHNLSRQFGNLTALDKVSLEIYPEEVVGLAGSSGAGKSLLVRILSGLEIPDDGRLFIDGREIHWPFLAQEMGIGVVYQKPELADQFDVPSNIFLGHEICWHWPLARWFHIPDQRRMEKESVRLLASLDLHLPSLHVEAGSLSSEQRLLIAVAQVMACPARLRIVDDPNLLSSPYQESLLKHIRRWQRQGIAVLFSSANLDHLFAVTDRILVLREGHLVANWRTDETSREEVVAALVGTTKRQQRTPVIWALDSYYRARRQAETLRHNQKLLERNLAAQGWTNQQLFDQLADQVQALDSANLALQDAQRRLLTEREEERKRLARELHDQMIQDLLSLNYQLEDIASQVKGDGSLMAEVHEVRSNIRAQVEELRRICGDLRPPTIDSLGLRAALQSFLQDWSRRTGIEAILRVENAVGRLPEAIELSVFRIVQEGANNVWKHANASRVEVHLGQKSPRLLQIAITDNGLGLQEDFDLSALSRLGHYGLLGISERVALMGGRLSFQNLVDGGLVMEVEIPHPRMMPASE